MPTHFDLVIAADHPSRRAEFSLCDAAGVQIAYRQTAFADISVSHQQGLFDLRDYPSTHITALPSPSLVQAHT